MPGRSRWAAAAVSPVLLISDLGRPERFLHMLRVASPTSPMSMGTWVLTGLGGSLAASTAHALWGWFPRLSVLSKATAGLLGPALSTYTAVLVANTAVPAWHEGRRELPFVFAASSAASAGGALMLAAPAGQDGPARRMAVLGAAGEQVAVRAYERRLRSVGIEDAYREGTAGRLSKLSAGLTVGGGLLAAAGRRRRGLGLAGAALLVGGAAVQRWAVFAAGQRSSRDPRHTVGPQRARRAAAD